MIATDTASAAQHEVARIVALQFPDVARSLLALSRPLAAGQL